MHSLTARRQTHLLLFVCGIKGEVLSDSSNYCPSLSTTCQSWSPLPNPLRNRTSLDYSFKPSRLRHHWEKVVVCPTSRGHPAMYLLVIWLCPCTASLDQSLPLILLSLFGTQSRRQSQTKGLLWLEDRRLQIRDQSDWSTHSLMNWRSMTIEARGPQASITTAASDRACSSHPSTIPPNSWSGWYYSVAPAAAAAWSIIDPWH